VDHLDLVEQAGHPTASVKRGRRETIGNDQLADVFGIELDADGAIAVSASVQHAKLKRNGRPLAPEGKKATRARKAQQDGATRCRGDPPMQDLERSLLGSGSKSGRRKESGGRRVAEAAAPEWKPKSTFSVASKETAKPVQSARSESTPAADAA
jgi:hypothetical protein